jgi:hypothetical protein
MNAIQVINHIIILFQTQKKLFNLQFITKKEYSFCYKITKDNGWEVYVSKVS